jgi:hypothetical protein
MMQTEMLSNTYEMRIGPVYYKGIIYRPTLELCKKWFEIMSTRPWFSKYDFWVEGSFANNLYLQPKWHTWDIDCNLTTKDNIMLTDIDRMQEIKTILIDMANTALHECNFYMDTYFIKYANNIATLAVGDHIWANGAPEDFIESQRKHILSYAEQVYRDGQQVSNWPKGEQVIDGLWQRYINFPSAKQVVREVSGRTYAEPVNLKQYYGAR